MARLAFLSLAICSAACTSCMSDAGASSIPSSNNPLPPAPAADDDSVPATPTARASNPFVLTDADPFSTFAADVDTASYDILRRSISRGVLPSASEVRLEEYVNYFAYDYPAPKLDSAVPFAISLAAGANLRPEARTKMVRVGIQAAAQTEQPAANLVFLIDVSGSMAAPNKLPLVKLVLSEALGILNPSDTVAIVTYAADTRVRLAPTPVRARSRIDAVIQALEAGGATNGSSGIKLAYEEAEAGRLKDGINHVVLCTDGDFNLGLTSSNALVRLIEHERETGVTLTALGFGERNNDAMMERVSDAGNGVYSVLYDEDQAIAYAHQRLLSSMVYVAQDMKIQVEFNPDHVYAYRLLGYEDRAIADAQFRNDRVDGGEVGAGHRVTALFELALTPADLPEATGTPSRGEASANELESMVAPDDLLRVNVRWKRPRASGSEPASEVAASLGMADVAADVADLDADASWAIGVANLAEVLGGSPYVQRSDLPRVQRLLAPLAGDHADRRELLELWPRVQELLGN
jgi:Ca-activated chloride channel homolog